MYLYNIARVATATTGTGTVTLGAAEPTFLTFADAGVADGNVVTYVIENSAGREIGRGIYSSTGPTLSRDAVINSTNANALVNLTGSSTVSITAANVDLPLIASTNDFRLSAVSGNSNPTTEQTAVTTIYLTPHNGNSIGLHDGTGWRVLNTSEVSLSLAGLAANTNFDVFAYINAGAVSLETLAWTNDTTRATELTTQDGIQVRSGDITRRYIGTIRTTSTIGQTEDSNQSRLIWNRYNQLSRKLYVNYNFTSNVYSTVAWRSLTGNNNYRVSFVTGVSNISYVDIISNVLVNTGVSIASFTLSLNSTTLSNFGQTNFSSAFFNGWGVCTPRWMGSTAAGFNFIQSMEYGGSGITTYGTNFDAAKYKLGMYGSIIC